MTIHYTAIHEEYLNWLRVLGYAPETIRTCRIPVRFFFLWLLEKNVHHITKLCHKHIENYLEYLQTRPNKHNNQTGLSKVSLNHHFDAVDKLLQFLHQQGFTKTLVPTNFRLKKSDDERIYNVIPFSQAQTVTLMQGISKTVEVHPYELRENREQQLKLAFILFYGCGLRKGEGFRLAIQDIDFDRKILLVRQGKNYKDRIIPLNHNILKALEDYIYNFRAMQKVGHQRLFIHSPASVIVWLREVHRNCPDDAIRKKRLSFHVLRHSIATNLLLNGMSIENIALFMGHESIATTQIYTHLTHHLE